MEGDVCGDEADDLTTEEELLLCGVRPGTATATWYRSLRQQLTRRHRRHSLASRVHFAPKGRDSLTHTDPYDRPNGSTSFPPTTSNNNYPLLLHANSGITSPRTRDATGGNSKNGTLMYPSLSAEGLFSPPASAHSRLATARSPSRHFGSTRFSNLTIGSSTGSIASGRRFHPGNTGGEVPPSLGQTARPLEVPRDVINCMTGAGATLVERTLPEGLREELALLRSTHSFDEPEQDAPHPPLHPRGSDGDVAPLRLMPSVGAEEAAHKSGEAAEEEAENPQDVVCSASLVLSDKEEDAHAHPSALLTEVPQVASPLPRRRVRRGSKRRGSRGAPTSGRGSEDVKVEIVMRADRLRQPTAAGEVGAQLPPTQVPRPFHLAPLAEAPAAAPRVVVMSLGLGMTPVLHNPRPPSSPRKQHTAQVLVNYALQAPLSPNSAKRLVKLKEALHAQRHREIRRRSSQSHQPSTALN